MRRFLTVFLVGLMLIVSVSPAFASEEVDLSDAVVVSTNVISYNEDYASLDANGNVVFSLPENLEFPEGIDEIELAQIEIVEEATPQPFVTYRIGKTLSYGWTSKNYFYVNTYVYIDPAVGNYKLREISGTHRISDHITETTIAIGGYEADSLLFGSYNLTGKTYFQALPDMKKGRMYSISTSGTWHAVNGEKGKIGGSAYYTFNGVQ